jgi:hypothetical protein
MTQDDLTREINKTEDMIEELFDGCTLGDAEILAPWTQILKNLEQVKSIRETRKQLRATGF